MRYLFFLISFIFMLGGCKNICKKGQCKNGGDCNKGKCYCEYGYNGETCDNIRFGSSLTIDSIQLLDFPGRNGSQAWDPEYDSVDPRSNPDLFFRIFSFYHDPGTLLEKSQKNPVENFNGLHQNKVKYDVSKGSLPVMFPVNIKVTDVRTIYWWQFQIEDYEGVLAFPVATTVEDQLQTDVVQSAHDSKLIENGDFKLRVYYSIEK